MSLNIWLTATVQTDVVNKDVTHNLIKMWKEAGVFEVLYDSKGKSAKEVLPTLKEGLQLMLDKPLHFKQFNASNGWGTYEDAITWLSELIVEFEKYPEGVIGVSQ